MRKRMLGGSSALPDSLRKYYTEGERAVLCVIAGEVKRQGVCDLSNDEIGDRAGVGRTTVQNTVHESRRLGHLKITERPVRGQKSLTNLVEIASDDWKVWIKRAPSAARSIGHTFKNASTSKIIDTTTSTDLTKAASSWREVAFQGGVRCNSPPGTSDLRDVEGQIPFWPVLQIEALEKAMRLVARQWMAFDASCLAAASARRIVDQIKRHSNGRRWYDREHALAMRRAWSLDQGRCQAVAHPMPQTGSATSEIDTAPAGQPVLADLYLGDA